PCVIHSDQWIGIALYHNGGTRDALLRIKQIVRIDHRRELTSNSGGIVGAVVGVLAALTNPRFVEWKPWTVYERQTSTQAVTAAFGSPARVLPSMRSRAALLNYGLRRSPIDYAVLLRAEPGDPHFHDVAGPHVARRLHSVGDACRRAGRDDVAGPQRHEAADIGHELPHAEDHVGGLAALARLTVDIGPHLELLRITDFVGGHEPRPDRCKRVAALALRRRSAVFHLKRALGKVVDDAIAGDVLHRVRLADVL